MISVSNYESQLIWKHESQAASSLCFTLSVQYIKVYQIVRHTSETRPELDVLK
jgi:hypothetical protein